APHAIGGSVARLLEIAEPELELAPETFQAARPALAAPDHRGFDEQLLPAPRSPQRAGLDRGVRRRVGIVLGMRPFLFDLSEKNDQLVVGRDPSLAGGRRWRRRPFRGRKRYLAERKVLREPARGEPFGGAG